MKKKIKKKLKTKSR